MSEQALLGCLHQLLDSDPSTRHAGEAQLSAASAQVQGRKAEMPRPPRLRESPLALLT